MPRAGPERQARLRASWRSCERGQQPGDAVAHLALLFRGEHATKDAAHLGLVGLGRSGQLSLAGRGEFHTRGAAVVGVGLTREESGSLDPIDELAGPTHRDAQIPSEVTDAHAPSGIWESSRSGSKNAS